MAELQGDNITNSAGTAGPQMPFGLAGRTDGTLVPVSGVGYFQTGHLSSTIPSVGNGLYTDLFTLTIPVGQFLVAASVTLNKATASFSAYQAGVLLSGIVGNDGTGQQLNLTAAYTQTVTSADILVVATVPVFVKYDGADLTVGEYVYSASSTLYIKGYANAYSGGPPTYNAGYTMWRFC
jgi:hypothetical protein